MQYNGPVKMVTCVQKQIRIIISMDPVQLDTGLKSHSALTKSSLVERILILLQCGYKLMCYSLKRNNLKFSYEVVKTHQLHLGQVWIVLKSASVCGCAFCVGLVHCSLDPQVRILTNFSLKLGLTVLFTHLKIILLQCFQFSAISGIQIDSQCAFGK